MICADVLDQALNDLQSIPSSALSFIQSEDKLLQTTLQTYLDNLRCTEVSARVLKRLYYSWQLYPLEFGDPISNVACSSMTKSIKSLFRKYFI